MSLYSAQETTQFSEKIALHVSFLFEKRATFFIPSQMPNKEACM